MIQNIIAFSIRNKLIIILLILAWIAGGIWSTTRIPLDAVPDITNNQVQLITQVPSLGTEDVEQLVTYPIELAMANLPGVLELRSVSRSGLSLVTIVFEDDMGIYLPRQLVSEKLVDVKAEIPASIGEPFMGPISTGLGEIYQYTLEVDPKFQEQYSPVDLREIQDWIVRRQMAMVPGVIEVNAFGGGVKQYEVAVKPDVLKSMGITIADVFHALKTNNENSGGAYIEKDHQAQFIRGEGLVRNISDIENIVVKNVNGIPITINQLAQVRFGTDIRFGAFTANGEGEAVGGMILMMKGANSNQVITAVKERVEQIQKSLPDGVRIVPFLDRSTLISNTTTTVSTNLLEGALIVIFVLVFLLGNWRGGLIVASTIPLSLLFAFILMNAFGVWANLMSLGAIDFGIIIDGAVIIVESTVFLLQTHFLKKDTITIAKQNKITLKASSKMMNSAFFGQLIILIVFIPILALQGIEGKMFKPMALTFIFAMIGVMILCLTYVPMMSAWLLKVKKDQIPSWGDRFVKGVEIIYGKALNLILKKSLTVVSIAVALLITAIFTFSKMGGEFIPKLDEGDIAFHDILKPGSSLSESIRVTTAVEKKIKDNFPEVKSVLSRIGVAEVPTDPMPMDVADCFIILKPKSQWVHTKNKAELVEMIKTKVQEIPGINYEFTQPIEMRFNELITGVREDIAIKLFGDDLDILASKAGEIGRLIKNIKGVGDLKVESTEGLPQLSIRYDRKKIAQYGLNIESLNMLVKSAFAGGKAGLVFEGEKRFDLVVRLDQGKRSSIEDLKNLYVVLENNAQIPLHQLAAIQYESGPMQISRENTNRRTYVGVNVRGRDIKTLVSEIQQTLERHLELPAGYYIRYGGAFENLERATSRLQVVVPIALALIFLLIFLALRSIKQTLMIYIAIPLSAIGGIFSLWIRDMPFSISAGVGFIVLFGIAVLNGLVLISGWNELKEESDLPLLERITQGAKRRIRPILLTAITDILGFMPMAISSSAGAEVQRPLATVVIGGMISATLLTLFVLPILYRWMENRKAPLKSSNKWLITALLSGIFLTTASSIQAQNTTPLNTLEQVIAQAEKNNGGIKAAQLKIEEQQSLKKTSWNLPKTSVGVQYGQYNSYEDDLIFNVNQSFAFPTVYGKQSQLARDRIMLEKQNKQVVLNKLKLQIGERWFRLHLLFEKLDLLQYQDSLYLHVLKAAETRYETGESALLEKLSVETRCQEIKNKIQELKADINITKKGLNVLINDTTDWDFSPLQSVSTDRIFTLEERPIAQNPSLSVQKQKVALATSEKSLQKAKMLPDLSIGYFNQSMIGMPLETGSLATSSDRFVGIQAGVKVPLFFGSYSNRIKAASIHAQQMQVQAQYYENILQNEYEQQQMVLVKHQNSLDQYSKTALPQADMLIKHAELGLLNEAISYEEYIKAIDKALEIKRNYLEKQNKVQIAQIQLSYLMGN